MTRRGLLPFLILLLAFLIGVPIFYQPKQEKIEAQRELIVLSPHPEATIYEFDRAFRGHWLQKTGEIVKLRWLYMGGGTDALRFLLSEFHRNPEKVGIDLLWGGGVDPFEKLRVEGFLDPLRISAKELEGIPQQLFGYFLYSSDLTWYGTALSGFGIIYNKKILDRLDLPVPATWEDLADPRCSTWVGFGDPANSSTAHTMSEFILQGYGFERGMRILTQIAANARRFEQHSTMVTKNVILGETAYALSIDFYAAAAIARAGADNIGFVLPDRLTIVNPDPIAILKGAPHRDLAEEFIRFSLSEEAQRLWVLPVGDPQGPQEHPLARVPIRPSVMQKYRDRSILAYDPFQLTSTLPFNQKMSSSRWGILNDFLRAALIDNHGPLKEAWKAILSLPKTERGEWIARLSTPMVSEPQMLALQGKEWSEPVTKNRIRSEWTNAYTRRYREIAEEIHRDGGGRG